MINTIETLPLEDLPHEAGAEPYAWTPEEEQVLSGEAPLMSLLEFADTVHGVGGLAVQNAGGRFGRPRRGPSGGNGNVSGGGRPDGSAGGEGSPPSGDGRPEFGEDGRELIAECNFIDYYLYRKNKLSPGMSRADVFSLDYAVEQALGKVRAADVEAVTGELRSNYYEHCNEDITNRRDSGNRILRVSRDADDNIYIDYYVYADTDVIRPLTFSTYAVALGQEPEPLSPQDQEILKWRRVYEMAKAAKTGDYETLRMMAFLGSGEDGPGVSGRGLPMMLLLSKGFIRRYGASGKGAHMQLVMHKNPMVPADVKK